MDYYCSSCRRHYDGVFCELGERGDKYYLSCPECGKTLSEWDKVPKKEEPKKKVIVVKKKCEFIDICVLDIEKRWFEDLCSSTPTKCDEHQRILYTKSIKKKPKEW